MKIVHVMNWYVPNMGYQENFLPAEQKRLGHNVYIITSDRVPPYKGYKGNVGNIIGKRIIGSGIFEENNVEIYRLPSLIEIKNGGQILIKGLKKRLKELKPDIVQAHGAFSPLTIQVILYSKELNYKVFVDDHSHKNNFQINSFFKKLYIIINKIFYRVYGKSVCCWMPVTYSSKQILQSLLTIPNEKIGLLHLGVDINRFKKSVGSRKIFRNENNINDNELLIISAGKFDECKDIHYLINAFGNVLERFPQTKLFLIGSGPEEYMKNLKDFVNSTNLNDRVFFYDFVQNSELPKYYNAADIGIWPGDHSITVIEAVATGLPVIVPEDDLAYKVLFEHNAALGFERGNINSLLKAILKLIDNQKLRSMLADNSILLATDTLSWKKIAEKSISIYVSKMDKNALKK